MKTVTYNPLTHKIVPIRSNEKWARNLNKRNGEPASYLPPEVIHALINELLAAAPEYQESSQWVSVEERLPEVKVESFEFYLVTTLNLKTKKQSVIEAAFLNEMELYSDEHDPQLFSGWHNAKESKDYDGWYEPLGNENCKVTHWMPLPLPPSPDGDKP